MKSQKKHVTKIRWWRNKRGYTLLELEELTGIKAQQLSMWENNRVFPTLRSLSRVAEALGVNVTALFFTKTVSRLSNTRTKRTA